MVVLITSLTPTFAMLFKSEEIFGKTVISRSSRNGIREKLEKHRLVVTQYSIDRTSWVFDRFSLKKSGSASEINVFYATAEKTDAPFLYLKLENDLYRSGFGSIQTLTIKSKHPPFSEYYSAPHISMRLLFNLDNLYSEASDCIEEINHKNMQWRCKIKTPEFRSYNTSRANKILEHMGGYTSAPWWAELEVRFDDRVSKEAANFLEKMSDKMEFPDCLKQHLIKPFKEYEKE